MRGFRSLSDVFDDDELREADARASVLTRGRQDEMAKCSVPECAAKGGQAGHRGRHRGSQLPRATAASRPQVKPIDGEDDEPIELLLSRTEAEWLRDLAVAGAGPQPVDVFSDEFDAWRERASVVKELTDALKGDDG